MRRPPFFDKPNNARQSTGVSSRARELTVIYVQGKIVRSTLNRHVCRCLDMSKQYVFMHLEQHALPCLDMCCNTNVDTSSRPASLPLMQCVCSLRSVGGNQALAMTVHSVRWHCCRSASGFVRPLSCLGWQVVMNVVIIFMCVGKLICKNCIPEALKPETHVYAHTCLCICPFTCAYTCPCMSIRAQACVRHV